VIWLGVLVLGGCNRGGNGESVPETPPPASSPNVTAAQVFRPVFQLTRGTARAGTGYFLTAPSGKVVALTAYHVLDKQEWNTSTETRFEALDRELTLVVGKTPDYLGRSFDELTPIENGRFPVFDTSEDFAVWVFPDTRRQVLADAQKSPVLELAAEEPKVNQWVWVAGAESGRGFALFLAKVTKVKGGTVMMQQHAKFAPMGFSSGPVLSADGKVVGNVLAADPNSGQMAGATANTIRKRIEKY
jgi:hypothetical protein